MKNPNQTPPDQLPRKSRLLPSVTGTCIALAAVFLFIGSQFPANAQFTDNFDSYSTPANMTAAGWNNTYIAAPLVTTTFPPVGSGQGVRITGMPFSPYPGFNSWYRLTDYTDFYVAMDLINWQGNTLDQACVLFGRLTDASTASPYTNYWPRRKPGQYSRRDLQLRYLAVR